jgi:hypothetical protein
LTAEHVDAGHIDTFLDSEYFAQPGRLISRFAAYLTDLAARSDHYDDIADVASLEAWASADPRRDEHAERFAQEPETIDEINPEHLRLNRTLRRASFGVEAVSRLADAAFEGERVDLVGAYWRGELHLLVLDNELARALDQVDAGEMPEEEEVVLALMEAGVLIWVPATRSKTTIEAEV